MTRGMLSAALVLAAAGSAQARDWCDGLALGLSIGFPIGDCGFGTIGIGTGGWGVGLGYGGWGGGGWGGGWGGYGGGSCRPYDCGPSWCDRSWYDENVSYGRGRYASRDGRYDRARYADAGPRVISVAGAEPSARRAVPEAIPAPSAAELEANAWKALAANDASAMEQFAKLVIRADATSSASMGYAISAAGAGQLDRATWATREALRSGQPLAGVPTDEATRTVVASCIATLEQNSRPGTRDRAVVVAALKIAAGDAEAAGRALDEAMILGEPAARLASLRSAAGVTTAAPQAPAPATVVSAK